MMSQIVAERQKRLQRNELARFYPWKQRQRLAPLTIHGDVTYIAADGTRTPLSGHTYIRLPGNVPHALRCGKTPCMFYVRYTGPFDSTIHPMPAKRQ